MGRGGERDGVAGDEALGRGRLGPRIRGVHKQAEVYYANFRVNRDRWSCVTWSCVELICARCCSGMKAVALLYSPDYPDTLPVSFPTVVVQEVRSPNEAVQSPGRWRDTPR